jgi:hypothetical protein
MEKINTAKIDINNKIVDWQEFRVRGFPLQETIPTLLLALFLTLVAPKWPFFKSLATSFFTVLSIDVFLERETAYIERLFDMDHGWISKMFFIIALALYMEN